MKRSGDVTLKGSGRQKSSKKLYDKKWWEEEKNNTPVSQRVLSRIPELCKEKGWDARRLSEHAGISYNIARKLAKDPEIKGGVILTYERIGKALGIPWPRLFEVSSE